MNTMMRDTFTRDWFIRREWKINPFNEALKDNNYDEIGLIDKSYQMYNCGLIMAEYDKMINFLERTNRSIINMC